MKIVLTTFLLAFIVINSSAQANALEVYTICTFENYDFSGFGGRREFVKSIYKRIRYPIMGREREKEGSIRAVLRYNGDGTYDIYSFTVQQGTCVTFHQEVERVLREVVELSTNESKGKAIVEMLFTFKIDRDYKWKNSDCKTGQFCVIAMPVPPSERNKMR